MLRIALGADHAGFELKEAVREHLLGQGVDVTDLGTDSDASVDYPDFGAAVGRAIAHDRAELGIGICGSGIGIAIAANKVHGVRAATVHDVTSSRLAREHNDANMCCIGARLVGPQVALDIVDAFVATDFAGGRHQRRVDLIGALEAADPVTTSNK